LVIEKDDVNVMIKSVWKGEYYDSIPRPSLILFLQIQPLFVLFLRSYVHILNRKWNHSYYMCLLIIHWYIFNIQL